MPFKWPSKTRSSPSVNVPADTLSSPQPPSSSSSSSSSSPGHSANISSPPLSQSTSSPSSLSNPLSFPSPLRSCDASSPLDRAAFQNNVPQILSNLRAKFRRLTSPVEEIPHLFLCRLLPSFFHASSSPIGLIGVTGNMIAVEVCF